LKRAFDAAVAHLHLTVGGSGTAAEDQTEGKVRAAENSRFREDHWPVRLAGAVFELNRAAAEALQVDLLQADARAESRKRNEIVEAVAAVQPKPFQPQTRYVR